jgi:predicted ATPase with chaperone activity
MIGPPGSGKTMLAKRTPQRERFKNDGIFYNAQMNRKLIN